MSRAPLILSAAAIFCASSLLALADEGRAIGRAMESGANVEIQKSAAKHGYRSYRHYHGYDEAPSAMVIASHPA